jgi:hypothetical protein
MAMTLVDNDVTQQFYPVGDAKYISALLCVTFSEYDFVLSSDLLLEPFFQLRPAGVSHMRRSNCPLAFSTSHKAAK